jgi:hypothetical protein
MIRNRPFRLSLRPTQQRRITISATWDSLVDRDASVLIGRRRVRPGPQFVNVMPVRDSNPAPIIRVRNQLRRRIIIDPAIDAPAINHHSR